MFVLSTTAAHTTGAAQSGGLIGPLTTPAVVAIASALVLWVVVYMLYRLVMTKRKDFGMPVRRRLLCRSLRVDNDQVADVPFWWTDLQIQLAVRGHWRHTLRSPGLAGNDPHVTV